MEDHTSIKKRIMFIKGEDYNFLTYNIFIILNFLNCVDNKSTLKDHRKLSFLIDFVSDEKLIDIIDKRFEVEEAQINDFDRELLNQSYTNSLLRIKTINQLVFTLTNEGYINLRSKKLDKLNISLNKQMVSNEFFKDSLFKKERENILRLKNIVQRISVIDISNMLEKLYYKHGVLNEQFIN